MLRLPAAQDKLRHFPGPGGRSVYPAPPLGRAKFFITTAAVAARFAIMQTKMLHCHLKLTKMYHFAPRPEP